MPPNPYQEIRDPIHVFIKLDDGELRVLDSPPVQRLRNIHQLAMSYLVYPGATHRRFEHSLGVMELAGRVFDVVTHEANINDAVRDEIGFQLLKADEKLYWRKVLRMAALCHDIGHLPFSHAAEDSLLPNGWKHEQMTAQMILSDEMKHIWESMIPGLVPLHVAKIAVGPTEMRKIKPQERFSTWETLLSEIISSDTLGVDRMDYLLRDSHHIGVAYGRFDHHRLIDTMRFVPSEQNGGVPDLGIEVGGIHTAESLLQARYYMFMQVYHHATRIAYDSLLAEFLSEWLPDGHAPVDVGKYLALNDASVLSAITQVAGCPDRPAHPTADRLINRQHFRRLYSETRSDRETHGDAASKVFEACVDTFGIEVVRRRVITQSKPVPHFPVILADGRIAASTDVSETLDRMPVVHVGLVLIAPEIAQEARRWWHENASEILPAAA